MKPSIWLGNQAAWDHVQQYELKYSLDAKASASTRFGSDEWDEDSTHPEFGVSSDRIGLTVLEKVGETTVIKVHGSLVPTFRRWHGWYPGEVTSYEALKDAMAIVLETGTEDIVMDFFTGGGAVRGLDTVTTMMNRLKKEGVSIHGHTDSASFSAGYWIMSGCQVVTAGQMAEVGSIGALMVLANMANTEETRGMTFTVLREGEFKALGNMYEPLTDSAKAHLQKNLKKTNSFFLNHVSAERGLTLDTTDSWAEGQTFYAADAVKIGLVDRVTSLDDIIQRGASANTGDRRSFEMKISPEKLAQIEAGADPKSVLTAAELKQYKADIEAAAQAETDRITAEQKAADIQAALDLANANKPKEGDDQPTGTTAGGSLTVELSDALKANGRLEAKVETLTEQLAAATASVTAKTEESASLLVLAQTAVEKLQFALGKPRSAKATAAEVLTQYNDLQSDMAKTFKTGQQSQDLPTTEHNDDPQANYRLKAQQQAKTTGR